MKKEKELSVTVPKSKMYFNADTQAAILEYVNTEDQIIRDKIYRERIHKAVDKLAEILIHKGKFYYAGWSIEEIKSEVVMHILEKLKNYTEDKGKAYSYFTVITWRFLINLNNNNYTKLKNQVNESSYEYNLDDEKIAYDTQAQIDMQQFFDEYTIYLDNNLARVFPRKKDMDIANAILEIMKRRNNIEVFNKKAIYIYIREMTNCKSSQITSIVGSFKMSYTKAWLDFVENGRIFHNKLYK
jgi:hypothetical protein